MFKFHTKTAIVSFVLLAATCPGQSTGSRASKKVTKKNDVYKMKVDPKSTGDPGAVALIKKISLKYQLSQPYAFAGDLEIARQSGDDPKVVLAKAKLRLTAVPGQKFELHVENVEKSPGSTFDLISDGTKTWILSPGSNEYTVSDAKSASGPGNAVKAIEDGRQPEPRDLVGEFALDLMPSLAGLASSAQVSFYRGAVLTVISKKDEAERQTLFYLTLNSETLAISKLALTRAFPIKGQKTLVRFDMNFKKFTVGEKDSESQFKFDPPKDAKLVVALPTDIQPDIPAPDAVSQPEGKPQPPTQTPPPGVQRIPG